MFIKNDHEALNYCKKNLVKIDFKKNYQPKRTYVILTRGFLQVGAQNLTQAVNRLEEMYHIAPNDYEKLKWIEDSQAYLRGDL